MGSVYFGEHISTFSFIWPTKTECTYLGGASHKNFFTFNIYSTFVEMLRLMQNVKLSRKEEELMEIIWQQEKVFFKDIVDAYPEPKPAATTIATLLKRMQDKAIIGYVLFGNSRQYYPLIKKSDYFSKHVKGIIKNYFGNSALQFASFFTTSGNMSAEELQELKKIIDAQIQKKKK
ncbi:MAG: BlaI/MecI/CopY family transcriptional regulator [Parafilimonas sp.]